VLTKGPIAVALPALVGILWLASERRLADLKRWHLLPGVAIILAIVVPWYVLLYLRFGW
jgi:4-amino-4-deoxy-L-arabinose transferase-like glycosyltransferase